jgi:hypothetical protein
MALLPLSVCLNRIHPLAFAWPPSHLGETEIDVENQRAEATWWNAAPDLPRGHGGLRVYRARNKLSRGVYKVCIMVGIRLEFVEIHVLYSKLHI